MIAFIAFNILDLDGSNLEPLTQCFDRLAIEGPLGVDPLPKCVEYLKSERVLTPIDSPDRACWQITERRAPSRLEIARTHRYHVSLPRDAVPG